MNPPAPASSVPEINRLHAEVVRETASSRQSLHAALVAAWQAGQLLLVEQRNVRRTLGAAWGLWLEEKFRGSPRTAQNYMRLAASTPDVSAFQGMSLRQVYLRLGIATEPKRRTDSPRVEKLPPHIRLAGKLLVVLSSSEQAAQSNPERCAAYRQDLRSLYERLRRLFEPGAGVNFPAATFSSKIPS